MGLELSLDDIRRAWDARDPELANLIIHLASASDPRPAQPPREGALSFASFTAQLGTGKFRREQPQARARYRIDTMKALEAANAEVPLPPRLQLHKILSSCGTKTAPTSAPPSSTSSAACRCAGVRGAA